MKFCRACGSALAAPQPGYGAPMMPPQVVVGAPMMPPAPPPGFGAAQPGYVAASPQLPPPGPIGGGYPPPGPLPPPLSRMAAAEQQQPLSTVPPTVPPTAPPGTPSPLAAGMPTNAGGMISCPRCNSPTPMGSAFCQQCGLHMGGLQPTDPGTPASRARTPSSAGVVRAQNADPQGATIASDGVRPPIARPGSQAGSGPATAAGGWGTAVLVNRDGSDGQRFTLAGEYTIVGRAGADIAFDDDRFLARQHARIERGADGTVRVQPMDALNGVFRKATTPIELGDGMTVLVGREVLRFERVDAEERSVQPLVRHGVALFGSPPREPWGRLVQIVPSGGYRDVRHLVTEEVVLGREEGDIVFRDDAFMSRRHAAVTWDGKKAQITDLGSSNGTFVRITGPTTIKHGDHVRMGDQLLRIELGR
jgi:pSer/pThr/pTyr-binding forkhead associated (FHA) protein